MRKGNSGFGELVGWTIGGFLFYKMFIKESSPVVAQALNIIQENDAFNINKDPKILGGNSLAKNIKGSGKFNFLNTEQLAAFQYSELPLSVFPYGNKAKYQPWGIECKFAAVLNLYKSLGLLPPNYSANQFEKEFTHIFNEKEFNFRKPTNRFGYTIEKRLTHDLRGRESLPEGQDRLQNYDYVNIAQNLSRVMPYAKKTGMNDRKFKLKDLLDSEDYRKYPLQITREFKTLKNHLANGGVAYSNVYPSYRKGHYVTIHRIMNDIFLCDDPILNLQDTHSKIKSYGTNLIRTAWTLEVT